MLIKNSKKIVIKLGSSTVVDSKGKFKKEWVKSLIKLEGLDLNFFLQPLSNLQEEILKLAEN